jgi:hypothetical protein
VTGAPPWFCSPTSTKFRCCPLDIAAVMGTAGELVLRVAVLSVAAALASVVNVVAWWRSNIAPTRSSTSWGSLLAGLAIFGVGPGRLTGGSLRARPVSTDRALQSRLSLGVACLLQRRVD